MHIRFYGHLRAGFGLAGGARATARCLEAAGCQLSYVDLALASHAAVQELSGDPSGKDNALAQVDLIHTNPNILSSNPDLLERHPLTAPLRIGYWAWELEQFPTGWERFFNGYHEIWCPSSFTAQALAQRSPVPVISLPHLPDWKHLQARNRSKRAVRHASEARPFTFLTLFDFWSTPERKNPAAVVRAFQRAFPPHDNSGPAVQLLVKASSAEQFPEQAGALKNLANGDQRIRWIEALLPQAKLDALYDQADALVSLHRSEGFGLTLADAMGMGIPVIATGYSGNLDFMPPGSAELIPWSPKTIERSRGDYMAGATWAEPDINSAAKAMRQLALNPHYASQLGLRGQAIAQERLSSERLSAVVRQRLGRWWLPPDPASLGAAATHAPKH